MKWRSIISLVIVIVTISACNTSKKVTQTEDGEEDICESMTYNNNPVNKISTDYYTIDSLFITDNCLNIWVSYSGGCGNSEFKLFYNNKIMQSMPPKTNLLLQLTDNDPCRAIVQQKLYFNLNFFEEHANKDGIVLKLVGTDLSILYKKSLLSD